MKSNQTEKIPARILQEIQRTLATALASERDVALGYGRISSRVQEDGLSSNHQADEITKYAKRKELKLAHIFQCTESAKQEGRRTFNAMIELALKSGIRDLVFMDATRLARNKHDETRVIDLVQKGDLVVHLTNMNMVIHEGSHPMEFFQLELFFGLANLETRQTSYRIKQLHRKNREAGVSHVAPWGYRKNTEANRYEIDPDTEGHLRLIFDLCDIQGLTLREITAELNNRDIAAPRGGKWDPESPGTLHHILTSKYYHGVCYSRAQNKEFPGTQDTFYEPGRYKERMAKMGQRRNTNRKRRKNFLLAGFLRCSCGKAIYGSVAKQKYVYYGHQGCKHGRRALQEPFVTSLLSAEVSEYRISSRFDNYLRGLLNLEITKSKRAQENRKSDLEKKVSAIKSRKNAARLRLYDGMISNEEYLADIEIFDAQLAHMEELRKSESVDPDEIIPDFDHILETLRELPEIFALANDEQKIRILRKVADGAFWEGDALKLEWKRPFRALYRPEFQYLAKNFEEGATADEQVAVCSKVLPR